jgi:glycosyltransferase involved in cell wall biosynthesis
VTRLLLPTEPARRLTIGIFVALLPPEHAGGAERQADRLARELATRGHRVHVFARGRKSGDGPEIRDGVHVHRRRVVPIPGLRLVAEVLIGSRQAARHKPDVLLCYITLNSGLIGYATHLRCRAPFVIWQRVESEALLRPASWRTRLAAFLNRRAGGLWVQAQSMALLLRREYVESGRDSEWHHIEPRLRVIGNAVDVPEATEADEPPPWRFLFVGRLVGQKDLPTLIAAARRLRDAEVWIVGDGPLEGALRRDAAGAPVRFLGRQPHERIAELLRDCRALVLCSLEEGMPNVVLEALAHGRPVVATAVGAVPELVRDGVNGMLVPVGDVEALAAALEGMRDEATWRRFAAAARPSALRFAWPELVARVERELEEVVAGRG